jgi:hypothetical protein
VSKSLLVSWHLVVHNSSWRSFVFLWYQLQCLLFYPWFYLGLQYFFLDSLAKDLWILSFFRSSSFHWSFCIFSLYFISGLITVVFFLLLILDLVYSFFYISLNGITSLFEKFLSFQCRYLLQYFSVGLLLLYLSHRSWYVLY